MLMLIIYEFSMQDWHLSCLHVSAMILLQCDVNSTYRCKPYIHINTLRKVQQEAHLMLCLHGVVHCLCPAPVVANCIG